MLKPSQVQYVRARREALPFTGNSRSERTTKHLGSRRQHSRRCETSAGDRATDARSAVAGSAVAAALLLGTTLLPPPVYALPQARLEEIRQQIDKDFSEGQYYVTGKLTDSLYDPRCTFKDPTTNVKGVKSYTTTVASLFDPTVSKADLLSSKVSGPDSITLRWRLEGRLKLGNLNIKPYTGTTVYTVDEETGLITKHTETWDISALDAFVSSIFPGFGAPPAPPVSGNST